MRIMPFRKIKLGKTQFLKLFLLLFFLLPIAKANGQNTESLEQQQTPILYEGYSECLRQMFLASDSLKIADGRLAEITFLRNSRSQCDGSSAIIRRIAMKYIEWGDISYNEHGVDDEVSRKELFDSALQWAKKAAKEDPSDHFNYEVLSMSYAAYLSVRGLRVKAVYADSVRINAENCIRLNPKNNRAYHILGRWHYEVAKLSKLVKFMSRLAFGTVPTGSYQKSVEYFQKAVNTHDSIVNRFWLAKALVEVGEKKRALENFKKIEGMKNVQENDPFFKQNARDIIDELEND